jgi:hypothetical protein
MKAGRRSTERSFQTWGCCRPIWHIFGCEFFLSINAPWLSRIVCGQAQFGIFAAANQNASSFSRGAKDCAIAKPTVHDKQQQPGGRTDQVILATQGIDLSDRLLAHAVFFTGLQVSGFFLIAGLFTRFCWLIDRFKGERDGACGHCGNAMQWQQHGELDKADTFYKVDMKRRRKWIADPTAAFDLIAGALALGFIAGNDDGLVQRSLSKDVFESAYASDTGKWL